MHKLLNSAAPDYKQHFRVRTKILVKMVRLIIVKLLVAEGGHMTSRRNMASNYLMQNLDKINLSALQDVAEILELVEFVGNGT
ncbi:hypothetical protein TURU_006422 [Turdus rufiventris]|nr:hypothetical protein TURU_006422 [Turdus rufiventris]